ncbi:hypothetical protein A2W24_01480 [Microgenomates group bacterium RBG_16_45_19]|nr:MAG: hypothetical protein A2W24_01480 [Microgenomates group bacterium RBG_16_45_19]
MKKIAIVVSILFLPLFVTSVFAKDLEPISSVKPPKIVTLAANETHTGDFFATGDSVIISGTITGDLYAAAGQIFVDGQVDGDILAVGGTINLSGQVGQDVRVAGGQVTVSGIVGQNLTLAGGNLEITADAQLGGNLVAAGGNLVINATVPGDLKAGVGNLMITSTVEGDSDVAVGQLTLTPKAVLRGDLTYRSDQVALIAGEATVAGILTRVAFKPDPKTQPTPFQDLMTLTALKESLNQALAKLFSALFWISFFASLIVGFLLVHFFPNYTYNAITTIENHPWRTLGVGFLSLVAAPALAIFLLVTLVGLPLSVLLFVVYGVALYFSRIIFSYWLGARFVHRLGRMAGRGLTLAIGLSLYYVLSIIVVVGPIIMLAALLWGLGAIVLTEKSVYLAARKARLI